MISTRDGAVSGRVACGVVIQEALETLAGEHVLVHARTDILLQTAHLGVHSTHERGF